MKLTSNQTKELQVWEYFAPKNCNWKERTDDDIKMFFEWSEQGKHKNRTLTGDLSYFEKLRQGKRWAGIHVHEMYEPGILSCDVPYSVLLEGMPDYVVSFLGKEMFKGADCDRIKI